MDRWTGWCFICSREGPCQHKDAQQRIETGKWWSDPPDPPERTAEEWRNAGFYDKAREVEWDAETAAWRRGELKLPQAPAQSAPAKKWHIPAHTRRPLPELEPTRPPKRIRCRPGPTHETKRLRKAREEWEQDTRRIQQPDPYAYMGVFPRSGYALAQWMTLESAFQHHLINQAVAAEHRIIDRVIEDHFPLQQFSEMYQMPSNARDFGHRYLKYYNSREEKEEPCDR